MGNIFLFDFFLHYSFVSHCSIDNKNTVFCSNITPDNLTKQYQDDSHIKVCVLNDCVSFNMFNQNFKTIWNLDKSKPNLGGIKCELLGFFDLLKKKEINANNIEWDEIALWLNDIKQGSGESKVLQETFKKSNIIFNTSGNQEEFIDSFKAFLI